MEQGMRQNMAATAAMQMFMRTLQATGTELAEIITQALASNPALEELPPLPDEQESTPLNREGTLRHARFLESLTEAQTLGEHLEEQIRRSALPQATEAAALALIPYLNHHGFFTEKPAAVARELGIDKRHYHMALQAIQDLEPAGVGAEDLRESLILQLKRKGEYGGLPMQLLQHHWEALVRHRYDEAANALNVEEEAVVLAARHIARLNPDPGSGFARADLNIVPPDVLVHQNGEELTVTLTNTGIPRLALSADYREMMAERADNVEVRSYLSRCFREGREFIRALDDRQQTILKVAQNIVERQKNFFIKGPSHIAPLKMEDIANLSGVSISTISRATRGKYLKCRHGLYELRSFFTTAINQDDGSALSSGSVQAAIRRLIEQEAPDKPLSDTDIARLLQDSGIEIARRTVAKYREQLKILPANLRRR